MYLYTPLSSISTADKYDVIQRNEIYSFILCRLLCDHHHQVGSIRHSFSCYYLLDSICILHIHMIYVDKTFIVPLSKLAKENIFIHKYVTKDFDFSVSLHYWECEFREMKPNINVSVLGKMG